MGSMLRRSGPMRQSMPVPLYAFNWKGTNRSPEGPKSRVAGTNLHEHVTNDFAAVTRGNRVTTRRDCGEFHGTSSTCV